ncbi:hypothetical protein [uncultured Rubinisphaera sp.]|uniref:hypothetical protein n=1 Tax=uncultured Rubinisphaera sp. TaxID=1678686 RepID=UPI0030DA6416|tara:strand:- start:162 stop:335 length:174 start_codon:yes stop_codon:yes gene_type:complete
MKSIFSGRILIVVGGVICLVGVIGLFSKISQNDGALAITGAILLSTGVMSKGSGFWK